MKDSVLKIEKRNTQKVGQGQMNNGDAGGLWKLLQKRMEHSQGDS